MWAFPGGSAVKNPPAVQETWVRYLGWENPQEKAMTIHSSILVWRVWRATVHGVTKSWTRLKRWSMHAYGMYKFKNHLHHLKRKLRSPLAVAPHPLLSPCVLSAWLFLSWIFHVSRVTMCVVPCLASFTWRVFRIHPCCSTCQCFISFQGWIVLRYVDGPHLVCSFICWWTFEWLSPFDNCE